MTSFPYRRLRITLAAVLVASAGLGLSGCVSQEKYDDLFEANRTLRSRNQELQARLESSGASLDSLRGDASGARMSAEQLQEANALLRQQLEAAQRQIGDLEGRLDGLELVALPADLNASLVQLASEYPGLLTYDAERGMIRFASDLTFGLGSAQLTPEAQNGLRQLASVLNTASARDFTIRVVGHTDSIAISDRIRNEFPTNIHLSVARSIAVRAELERLGVQGGRMQPAGWGPYRPLVANTASGITPQNRRVEIYLLSPGRDADRGVNPNSSTTGAGESSSRTGGSVRPDPDGSRGGYIPTK